MSDCIDLNNFYRFLIACFFCLALSSCPAQEEIELHGNLTVLIVDEDSDLGIEGVIVSISNDLGSFYDTTNEEGNAHFVNTPPGIYNIEMSHEKYFNYESKIEIASKKSSIIGPISLIGKPILGTSSDELNFTQEQDSAFLILRNNGEGKLRYLITTSHEEWVDVHPFSGELTDNIDKITVKINHNNIATEQTVNSSIIISSFGGSKDLGESVINLRINTIMDIDSNHYSIVNIYNPVTDTSLTWMQEDLRVTHSPDGLNIIEYKCSLDDCETYSGQGLYYSYDVGMNGDDPPKAQGICPNGWHIPDSIEYALTFNGYSADDILSGGITNFNALRRGGWNNLDKWTYYDRFASYASGDMVKKNPKRYLTFTNWDISGEFGWERVEASIDPHGPVRCIKDIPLTGK